MKLPSPIKHLPNRQQSRTIDWKHYDSLPGRTQGGISCVILNLYFTPEDSMAELKNLAGVVTKDLVDKIGTGKYAAAYVNWSRTMQLLRENAPGWLVDYEPAADGSILHRAPVGAFLMIRFRHLDGTVTPSLPQAVMDNRNTAIAYEKITARDVTDTQRRGMCMAAAMTFGLAYELWAKMPLENPYRISSDVEVEPAPVPAPKSSASSTTKVSQTPPSTAQSAPSAEAAKASEATEATFREAALEKGIHTVAIDALVGIVNDKLSGDFKKGLGVLSSKSAEELNAKYAPNSEPAPTPESVASDDGQW